MASQKDQIQSLIADIDGLLNKASPRLPWVMANDTTHQRQVLERVRNFLVSLQRRAAIEDSIGQPKVRRDLMVHDIYYQNPNAPASDAPQIDSRQPEPAQQILQSMVQEMSYLRESLMQPLQNDVEALRQQRETLTQEIRQLETQRQSYSLIQQQSNQAHLTNEMLQAYLGRLQDNLSQQITQALSQSQGQPVYSAEALPEGRSPALPAGDSLPLLHPAQRLEQAQLLQAQSDQMLMTLDSTLRTVFETLQRNVQGYQESLSQGVDRMHSLGQQGEMMFTALIGHLAQQLGREASSYLQPPASVAELQSPVNPAINQSIGQSAIGQSAIEGNRLKPSIQPPIVAPTIPQPPTTTAGVLPSIANLNLPFPGAELPPAQRTNLAAPGGIGAELPNIDNNEFANLGLQDIELEDLDLSDFGLDPADNQAIDALLNSDTFATDAGAVDETTGSSTYSSSPASAPNGIETDPADLDAALKLLEQLSSELQSETTAAPLHPSSDQSLIPTSSTTPDSNSPTVAEDIELEALYESLFGIEEVAAPDLAQETTDEQAMDESSAIVGALPTETDGTGEGVDAIDFEEIGLDGDWQAVSEEEATLDEEATNQFDADLLNANLLNTDLLNTDLLPTEQPEVVTADSAAEIAPEPFLDLTFESEADNAQLLSPLADEAPAVTGSWEEFLLAETVTDEPVAGESALFDRDFVQPEAATFDDPEITLDLSQPAEIDEISSLTDLFVSEPDEFVSEPDEIDLTAALSDIPNPQAEPPVTISQTSDSSAISFSEAIDLEEPRPAPSFAPTPTPTGSTTGSPEDSYIAAAPEESLLPSDRVDQPEPNLWLDENTLSQLSQDLSRLEGMEGFELALQETPADESIESLDFGFADWGEADQQSAEAPISAELELDDDLLAELSAALPDETPTDPARPAEPANLDAIDLSEGENEEFPAEPDLSASTFEQAPQLGQDFGLTLAAMNDLFADLLDEAGETPSASTAQSLNETDNFTLDGLDSLLEDLPPPSPTPSPAAEIPPEVTLEGMEDLFADAPAVDEPFLAPTNPAPTNTDTRSSETSTQDVTLDNAFGELAELLTEPEAKPSAPPDQEADPEKKK